MLVPLNDVNCIEDDFEEIYGVGLVERYSNRPLKFDHLTLADWAAS